MTVSMAEIEKCVLALLKQRAESASICPSDAARALRPDDDEWRPLMPLVRQVAARLAREGRVVITQGDAVLDPDSIDHGPIRLRRGPGFTASG